MIWGFGKGRLSHHCGGCEHQAPGTWPKLGSGELVKVRSRECQVHTCMVGGFSELQISWIGQASVCR